MKSVVNFFKNLFSKKESSPKNFCNCPAGCCCGRCERCKPTILEIAEKEIQEAESKLAKFSAKYVGEKKIKELSNDIDEIVKLKKSSKKSSDKKTSKDSNPPKRSRKKSKDS